MFLTEVATIGDLIEDWNAGLDVRREKVRRFNEELKDKYQNGELRAEALEASILPEPREVRKPGREWVYQWRQAFGWSMLTRTSDAQAWLPFHDADMAMARDYVNSLPSRGVADGLVLNFDQVWRQSFDTHRYKLAFKPREGRGKRMKKVRPNGRFDKKAYVVKGARKGLTVTG